MTEAAVTPTAFAKTVEPFIDLLDVGKTFESSGRRTWALRDVSISVGPNEFVTLIGPSGCGKTTVLRLIADIIPPTSGTIHVMGLTPDQARKRRLMSMVFQQPALLGWRTVLDNVQLPLQVLGRKGGKEISRDLLQLVGLEGFERHYPDELSGGMQQRVSIARALSFDPDILLMDEPFGALDLITRDKMTQELSRIWQQTKKTVVFVTHSIDEAILLSDRVVVFSARPGTVQACVPIDLPRPRGLEIRDSEEFHRLSRTLRGLLQ